MSHSLRKLVVVEVAVAPDDEVVFDEVAHVCEQLHALECATRAELLRNVQRLQLSDKWKSDGASSLPAWLSMRLGLSRSESAEIVRVADCIVFLPQVLRVFSVGKLSWKRLALIVRVASHDSDQWWADNGPLLSLSQLQTLVRKSEVIDEAEVVGAAAGRHFSWVYSGQSVLFRGSLPLGDGAVVTNALDCIINRRGVDPETGLYVPLAESAADALVELASLAIGDDVDADRATIVIEAPLEVFHDDRANGELNAMAISAHAVRRLACDARVQLATVDPTTGQSLGIGRTSRIIPPWLARRVKKRDQGCRFPGCTNQRWVHGHHIRFWSHGGNTEEDNLVTLCGRHHRFFHEAHWRIEGDPGGALVFIRPDGKRFDGAPPPLCHQAEQWVSRVHADIKQLA